MARMKILSPAEQESFKKPPAFNSYQRKQFTVIDQELTPDARALLDEMFVQENEGKYARYKLTLLKKLSQSTKPSQIRERAEDLVYLAELHETLKPILSVLHLGHEGIRYFANAVIKSDIFQLNQRDQEDRYVHVIAFIVHQYYRLQDNLVETLLSTIKSFQNSAGDHKEWCYTERQSGTSHSSRLSPVWMKIFRALETYLENRIIKVMMLINLRHLSVVEPHHDSIPQVEQQWDNLKQNVIVNLMKVVMAFWKRAVRLQNRVSRSLKYLFQGETDASTLWIIAYFKRGRMIVQTLPWNFGTAERAAVTRDGEFRRSLYKIFFFFTSQEP